MRGIEELLNPDTRGSGSVCLNLVIKGDYGKGVNLLDACVPYMDQIVVIHDGVIVGEEGRIFKNFCMSTGVLYIEAPDSGGWPQLHRRLALALTYTDWVLVIDSDEVPNEALLKGLDDLIQHKSEKSIPGYWITVDTTEHDGEFIHSKAPRLLRMTPGISWPVMAHNGPEWFWDAGYEYLIDAPEEMKIIHSHTGDESERRTLRNARTVKIILQRWSEYDIARAHAGDIAKGNPLAQEVIECYLQKLEQQ